MISITQDEYAEKLAASPKIYKTVPCACGSTEWETLSPFGIPMVFCALCHAPKRGRGFTEEEIENAAD